VDAHSVSVPVLIVGTSGFAIELCALIRAAGRPVAGFIGPPGGVALPAPHLGGDDVLKKAAPDARVLVAVGEPRLRERLTEFVVRTGRTLETFISAQAFVAGDATVEEGAMIYPHAAIHARVHLGRGVLVNSNASVGHETQIGDYCTVGPGVALGGRCNIGAGAYLGIGCSMLEQLTIAAGAVIGAGAVVVKDIATAGTYIGVPARPIS
jgi:sugar O-acyltransferase (sialic acid O-acetyltransferase NeuD family)